MSETPLLPVPSGHLRASSRQYRSASGSPTRPRPTDDLLAHLSPSTALQALRTPSGALERCLDAATASEQSFAMRAAVASKNIQDWLDELSRWPWPAGDHSAGFQPPLANRRKLSEAHGAAAGGQASEDVDDESWVGSMPAADVVRYDERIDSIQSDMDDLDMEEIKTHVLHHHILPLSRPGTPMSDSNLSSASSLTFNKMDDLTAIVTSVVLQALPNLSKLIRLMNTWNVRLVVLKKVPALLTSLADAEVAIRAGWDAVHVGEQATENGAQGGSEVQKKPSTLTRNDFHVMKLIVEKKIAKAAHIVDFMLNSLDGREETIPEHWIDRMDNVEEEYSQWVAACEHKIREAEWRKLRQDRPVLAPPTPQPDQDTARERSPEREDEAGDLQAAQVINGTETEGLSSEMDNENKRQQSGVDGFVRPSEEDQQAASRPRRAEAPVVVITVQSEDETPAALRQGDDDLEVQPSSPSREENDLDELEVLEVEPLDQAQPDGPKDVAILDGLEDPDSQDDYPAPATLYAPVDSGLRSKTDEADNGKLEFPTLGGPIHLEPASMTESPDESAADDEPDEASHKPSLRSPLATPRSQPSIASLPDTERGESVVSTAPTITPDDEQEPLEFDSPSALPRYQDSPELPRMRDMDVDPIASDDLGSSPPSSPANRRHSIRSLVPFKDMPTVAENPDDDGQPPRTPLGSSFVEEAEAPRDVRSASRLSIGSEDDQLQQQISEILESIPAKIHLSSQPSPISHLNPPEFQMPQRQKAKPADATARSHSSMSSRAGTPSFLLAPAYARNPRPRHHAQRANQEIKLYHLSRSTGEAPIKLFIRLVGENGERVMVRVGGGWADLGEYLKEYASHHGRRSKNGASDAARIEVRDLPPLSNAVAAAKMASSPPSRPASALDSPMTPLNVRKTRKGPGIAGIEEAAGAGPTSAPGSAAGKVNPKTPLASSVVGKPDNNTPSSGASTRSRSSSRLSWSEEESSLGMSGPRTKNVEMSEESRAWVESVKEKVRLASGERKPSDNLDGKFGEMGKVGGTKRLFRKGG